MILRLNTKLSCHSFCTCYTLTSMRIKTRKLSVTVLLLVLLGIISIPCVKFLESAMAGMDSMEMPMGGGEPVDACCVIQPFFDYHPLLWGSANLDDSRNALLLVMSGIMFSMVAGLIFLRGRPFSSTPSKIRSLESNRIQYTISGLERLLHRGILHPRIYESSIFLN